MNTNLGKEGFRAFLYLLAIIATLMVAKLIEDHRQIQDVSNVESFPNHSEIPQED